MKYEKGEWWVIRDCCRSGNCFECRGLPKPGPIKIVHGYGYSEAYAKFVARNWSIYRGEARPPGYQELNDTLRSIAGGGTV